MIPTPNYTQTPNIFFDAIMKTLNESELKVFLAIVRKTFGWSKTRDRISLSQIMVLTGLSRQGVLNGLHGRDGNNGVIGKGLILVFESSAGNEYEIHVSDSEVVHNVDQSKNQVVNEVDRSGQRSRPEVVHNVDLQKNSSKETIQKKVNSIPLFPDDPISEEEKRKEKQEKLFNEVRHQGPFQKVRLTINEGQKLVDKYGQDETTEAINFLDAWIQEKGEKGKKPETHYLTLIRWVFLAAKEKRVKEGRLANAKVY